jgi:hypothetical protein
MNILRLRRVATTALAAAVGALPLLATPLVAQAPAVVTRLVAEPARVSIQAGQAQPFKVTAYDASGRVVPDAVVRVGGPRGAVMFTADEVRAFRAGSYTAVATASNPPGTDPITLEIPVLVSWPTLTRIAITAAPGTLVQGVMLAHAVTGYHADGSERPGLKATWRSSAEAVASVDRFGNVTAHAPGAVTITADAEGISATTRYTVTANPVTRIAIDIPTTSVRTGDVVHLKGRALDARGNAVADAALTWSYVYTPDDTTVAPGGPGIIDNGLFAANAPGQFTLIATSGNVVSRAVLDVAPRDVRTPLHGDRPRRGEHHRDVGPVAVDRQGRARLRARRHVGRRRLRARLRHHRHEQHRQDRLDQDRCAHHQRRDGLPRRSLRRAGARGRVEPGERRRDPRPRQPGAPEDRLVVRARSSPAACTTCSPPTTTCSRSAAARSTSSSTCGHLQAEVRERVPAPQRAHSRPVGARRHCLLAQGGVGAVRWTWATASTAARSRSPS